MNNQIVNISFLPKDFDALVDADKLVVLEAMKISIDKQIANNTATGVALQTRLTVITTSIAQLNA